MRPLGFSRGPEGSQGSLGALVTPSPPQDPQGCVRLEVVNVSQLLGALVQHLGGLQGRPPHFPGCAHLRCRPGTTPAPPENPCSAFGLPDPLQTLPTGTPQ